MDRKFFCGNWLLLRKLVFCLWSVVCLLLNNGSLKVFVHATKQLPE